MSYLENSDSGRMLGSLKWISCYFILMLVPSELFFKLGTVRVEPYRLLLIFGAIFTFVKVLDLLKCDRVFALLCSSVFMSGVSFLYHKGASGIESFAIYYLELVVGFVIGMQISGNRLLFEKFIKFVCGFYIALAPFGIIESIDGYRLLHVLAADISGNQNKMMVGSVDYLGDAYYRYGLHRASTVFLHPILYSLVAALTITLVWTVLRRNRILWSSGLFVALVVSVTSSGVLMVLLFMLFLLLRKVREYFSPTYTLIVLLGLSVFSFLSVFSNRGPVPFLIDMLAFNSGTGYTRYLQWQYAIDDVMANAIFGIGLGGYWSRPFWMSPSVDNYWLMTSLYLGIPAFILLAAFYLFFLKKAIKVYSMSKSEIMYFGFVVIIFQLILAGITVHFFDRAVLYIFLVLGAIYSFLSIPVVKGSGREF